MPKSLHMKHNDYNIAVTVFTVSYVVFGMPANLVVKKLGPKMLAIYMFCWGMSLVSWIDQLIPSLLYHADHDDTLLFRPVYAGTGSHSHQRRAYRMPISHGHV